MLIRIANKWNKQTNSYDPALFDIREGESTISGRFKLSAKKEEKWISAHMAFTAFKNDLDLETKNSLINHNGKLLNVKGRLIVDKGPEDKGYFKFIIDEARPHAKTEAVTSFHETASRDDEIPF